MSPSFEELARDWLVPPAPLADDAVIPEFDPEAALREAGATNQLHASLARAQRPGWDFQDFAIRPGMSVAESMFWLRVAADSDYSPGQPLRWRFASHEALARYPESVPTMDELEALIVRAMRTGGNAAACWLVPLIGLRQVVEWYLSGRLGKLATKGGYWYLNYTIFQSAFRFSKLVRAAEWQATLGALSEHLDLSDWCEVRTDASGPSRLVRRAWRLAGAMGHVEPVRALVESWDDDVWQAPGWHHDSGMDLVCQVRDAAFSRWHLRRLGLRPRAAHQVGVWLLHTGDEMLEPVVDLARKATSREEASAVVRWLGEHGSDQSIARLLELSDHANTARASAAQWLADGDRAVVESCVRLFEARDERAAPAGRHLHRLWAGSSGELVEECLRARGSAGLRALLDEWHASKSNEVGLEELPDALKAPGKSKALPDWLDAAGLSPLVAGGRRLSQEAVRALLGLLRNDFMTHPGIAWIRSEAGVESREAFWQSLVTAWTLSGSGKRDSWCLRAAVALRGPATAANLARLIMRWPTESQHQKAAEGLECLRAMADAPALQALVDIAQRTRLAGLRTRAEACVATIAAELGLTTEELADTSVPACGFDQEGTRVFDLGQRRLVARLGLGGALLLRTEDGRPLKTFPKPAASEDEAGVRAAAADWKALKKTLTDTLKVQTRRLEHAMVTGRRWSPLNFERYVARHPVVGSLAATLVWGVFDAEGMLRTACRIDYGSGGLLTLSGTTVALTEPAVIGVAHPLQLSAADLAEWRRWAGALGCDQVVSQTNREIERVGEHDAQAVCIGEFTGKKINAATLRRRMDGLAWRRGVPQDAGLFYEYSLPFVSSQITAVMETSGQSVVTAYDFDEVVIKRVFFVAGHYEPKEYHVHEHGMPLGLVDDVAYGETLRALRQALRPARAEG